MARLLVWRVKGWVGRAGESRVAAGLLSLIVVWPRALCQSSSSFLRRPRDSGRYFLTKETNEPTIRRRQAQLDRRHEASGTAQSPEQSVAVASCVAGAPRPLKVPSRTSCGVWG